MDTFRRKRTRLFGGAALVIVAFLPGVARAAATQQFTFLSSSAWSSSAVVVNLSGWGNVWAGRYKADLGSQSNINIFCTDFEHEIHNNQSYTTLAMLGSVTAPAISPAIRVPPTTGAYFYATASSGNYTGGGLQSAFTKDDYKLNITTPQSAQRASEVGWLADRYLSSNTLTKQQLGGVQLAMWDIIQDGGNGLGTGTVRVSGSQNADGLLAINDAATYLAEAALHTTYVSTGSMWIQSGSSKLAWDYKSRGSHYQDFVTSAPTPEPMSMVLVGVGLSSVAALRRRREDA